MSKAPHLVLPTTSDTVSSGIIDSTFGITSDYFKVKIVVWLQVKTI